MSSPRHSITVLTGAGFSLPYLEYQGHRLSTEFLTRLLCDEDFMASEFHKVHGREPEEEFRRICQLSALLKAELQKSFESVRHLAEPNFEMIICLIETLISTNPGNRRNTDRLAGGASMPNLLGHVLQVKSAFAEYKIGVDDLFAYQEFMLDVVSKFKCPEEGLEELGVFFNCKSPHFRRGLL